MLTGNGQERWIHEAVRLAENNVKTGHGGPFGALVVRNDEVIATGVNEVTRLNDPTAHAEVMAIRQACAKLGSYQLHDCELYTSCEPCPMCLGAIYWAHFKGYYFACTRDSAATAGFDDAFIYEQLHLKPESRTIPGHCVTTGKSEAPFVEWAQSVQRIRY
jgi:guanine deaminase